MNATNPEFDLAKTLESGECFNWLKSKSGAYYSALGNAIVSARQGNAGGRLELTGWTAEQAGNYFALDHDLKSITKAISVDSTLREACDYSKGITIIRQDPWECCVSFICSQNNNIPRITKMLQRIREQYGTPTKGSGVACNTFPTPAQLAKATPTQLEKLGLGYRARFVSAFAKHVARHKDDFNGLKKKNYLAAREALMEHLGIGRKVADCICLFSLEKLEAFPVDVWIYNKMMELYGAEVICFAGKKKPNEWDVAEFARKKFGRYAGYAQQYLYYWARKKT